MQRIRRIINDLAKPKPAKQTLPRSCLQNCELHSLPGARVGAPIGTVCPPVCRSPGSVALRRHEFESRPVRHELL